MRIVHLSAIFVDKFKGQYGLCSELNISYHFPLTYLKSGEIFVRRSSFGLVRHNRIPLPDDANSRDFRYEDTGSGCNRSAHLNKDENCHSERETAC